MPAEAFNLQRIERCTRLATMIEQHWNTTGRVEYVAQCDEEVAGRPPSELASLYFTVGIPGNVDEIPFLDMLVVFSFLSQIHQARKSSTGAEFKVELRAKTKYTDEEITTLLAGFEFTRKAKQ